MNCQSCRTPLELDISLQDLNVAAFDLLTGRSSSPECWSDDLGVLGSAGHSVDQTFSTSRVPYPQDRKKLYSSVAHDADPPVFKRTIPTTKQAFDVQHPLVPSNQIASKGNPDMSFIMLTDSQFVTPQQATHESNQKQPDGKPNQVGQSKEGSSYPRGSVSRKVESANRIFEILSSQSDIDHPICMDCTELLLVSLQTRLAASTKERDAYTSFLKTLNNSTPTPAEIDHAQASLDTAKAAQSKALEELLALEKEKASLHDDIANLEAESLALDDEEQAFWRSRNSFALNLSVFQNDRDALNAAYDHDSQQLERLQRTNVYNDTFSIGHDGFFGTINGLRLGRLPPPQNVDWSEINAAWGTAALLLATVADKLGFSFKGYRIKAMGSTSTIEKLEYPSPSQSTTSNSQSTSTANSQRQQPKVTSLDLFSSGDLPLGRMLLHRRLDAGMVAFLECLRQVGEFGEIGRGHSLPARTANTTSPFPGGPKDPVGQAAGLNLPYAIKKDKIGDTSIKLSVSDDEAWTRACKFALTCCKYLLAHASNVDSPDRRGGRV